MIRHKARSNLALCYWGRTPNSEGWNAQHYIQLLTCSWDSHRTDMPRCGIFCVRWMLILTPLKDYTYSDCSAESINGAKRSVYKPVGEGATDLTGKRVASKITLNLGLYEPPNCHYWLSAQSVVKCIVEAAGG